MDWRKFTIFFSVVTFVFVLNIFSGCVTGLLSITKSSRASRIIQCESENIPFIAHSILTFLSLEETTWAQEIENTSIFCDDYCDRMYSGFINKFVCRRICGICEEEGVEPCTTPARNPRRPEITRCKCGEECCVMGEMCCGRGFDNETCCPLGDCCGGWNCCEPGQSCCLSAECCDKPCCGGRCCGPEQICKNRKCVCRDNETPCGDECCQENEACTSQDGCISCPDGTIPCGDQCCPPINCNNGKCECASGKVLCKGECCPEGTQSCDPITGECSGCCAGETLCPSGYCCCLAWASCENGWDCTYNDPSGPPPELLPCGPCREGPSCLLCK